MEKVNGLLSGIEEVSEEVSSHDLENSSGGGFINACGVYPTTIEKAFLTPTKKGGVKLDIFFGGANKIDIELYIVSFKDGKKITTCKMKGKTVSLPDFKMFKQLYFLATGVGLDLNEVETKTETIKYKKFGKAVSVEAESIPALIGKEVQIGIRLEEQYNYEDGEEDKTSLRVNTNGDVVYKKELESIFNADGFDAMEVLKEATEAKAIKSKITFLESDKGIKRVKLELPEVEETEEEEAEDELDF